MPPVRMPDIPGLNPTRIDNPEMSGAAAAAPARALGELAEGISALGEPFAQHATRIADMENGRIYAERQNEWAGKLAQHQLDVQKIQDPSERLKATNDFLKANQPSTDGLAPAWAHKMTLWSGEATTNARDSAGVDAFRLSQRRAGQALDNQLQSAVDYDNLPSAHEAITTGIQSGLITPEEGEARLRQTEKAIADRREIREVDGDWKGWLDAHPDPTAPAGTDPVRYQALRNRAMQNGREHTADVTDAILDGMTGNPPKITTPEQIDTLAADLRPAAREALKDQLKKFAQANYKDQVANPEYQAQMAGQVQRMMREYKPDGDGFDDRLVQMKTIVGTLPPGSAIREELERNLGNLVKGTSDTRNDNAAWGRKELANAIQSVFPNAKGQSPTAAINDGLLDDTGKVTRYGFSPEWADKVAKARYGKDAKGKPLTLEAGRKAQVELFRQLAANRGAPSADADPFANAMLDAIRNGKDGSTMVADPTVTGRMDLAAGTAATAFEDFLRANPKATATDIRNEAYRLASPAAKSQGRDVLLGFPTSSNDLPAGGTGNALLLPEKPGAETARITSYGYPGDTTPDRNSSNGIGAFTTAADANGASDAPTRLRPGDIAVSPDVERELTAAGIKPRQVIRVMLADGSTHVGRWMDRTSDKLTGRIDIYSPNGPSALNDTRVLGWSL